MMIEGYYARKNCANCHGTGTVYSDEHNNMNCKEFITCHCIKKKKL
jgi:hypothetical protein